MSCATIAVDTTQAARASLTGTATPGEALVLMTTVKGGATQRRVAGKIVRFYTLRAQLLSRDGDLELLSYHLFASLCRKYAGLAARVVGQRPERC